MAKTTAGRGKQSHFSRVEGPSVSRSLLDRSHTVKTTLDAGQLIPIFIDEVLPGDTFNVTASFFCRMATPLHPVMENIYLDTHFFFVQSRNLWDNFKKFYGERANPNDHNDYTIPQATWALMPIEGSIADYFGIRPGITGTSVNALPFRGYNWIWNEFFRDPEIFPEVPVRRDDGPDFDIYFAPLSRLKRHDYFTTCRLYPQRGPEVGLPLGGYIPIEGIADVQPSVRPLGTSPDPGSPLRYVDNASTTGGFLATGDNLSEQTPFEWAVTGLQGNLAETTAANINQLRTSITIQQMYERDMRSGGRFTEQLQGHFGVTIPDAQWRPEYLGGSTTRININPVAQTSQTDSSGVDQSAQGNLAAYAVGSNVSRVVAKSFVEPGYIIGLASVRADLTYQQGVERMWFRETRFDFFYPTFQHLGEQEVWSKEIMFLGSEGDDTVFGYQERFAEYRYKPSRISGRFRSISDLPLDTWHLAQEFTVRPNLNTQFLREAPPMERILAVDDEPQFLLDAYFDMKCARPMAMYSTPGLRRL